MIDENGNKIDETVSGDSDFALAEMKFLMKGFECERDDSRALVIVSALNGFLKAGGEVGAVKETLEELEKYSYESENNDFLWGLVYARRSVSEFFQEQGKAKDAAVSRHIGARHFEKICKLRPSYYNFCCRIMEYVAAAKLYKNCYGQEIEAGRIITYAEALFGNLDESSEKIYLSAGQSLFLDKYLYLMKIRAEEEERYQALKRTVDFTRRLFLLERDSRNLKILMASYIDYSRFKAYPVSPEEEDNLKNIIEWGNEAFLNGNTEIKDCLDKLKIRLRILYGE